MSPALAVGCSLQGFKADESRCPMHWIAGGHTVTKQAASAPTSVIRRRVGRLRDKARNLSARSGACGDVSLITNCSSPRPILVWQRRVPYVSSMIEHLAHRIGVFVLTFGVFLNGAAGAWASNGPAFHVRPASVTTMSMSAIDMWAACASNHDRQPPADKIPCKCVGDSCIAGMSNVGLMPAVTPVASPICDASQTPLRDMNRKGLAVRPDIPPPILIA